MYASSSLKRAMLGFVFAVVAILIATPESRAQDVQPQRAAVPPVSPATYQSLQKTPDGWNNFVAQLPRIPGIHPQPTQNRVETKAGGSWTNVPANPSINPNGGLCSPLLLTDGSVLVHDCDEPDWWKLTPDINGSYANGTWSQVASMPVIQGTQYAPLYTASTVLPDGRVIVEGGEYNNSDSPTWVSLGAIFDPLANTWTPVTRPSGWPKGGSPDAPGIGDAESVVLADGTWMLAACCGYNPALDALFDPTNLTYTATGAPNSGGNYQDEQGYELLPNAEVLTIDIWTNYPNGPNPTNTELYSASAGTWSAGANTPTSLVYPLACGFFEIGPAPMRPDGTLVAFGGNTGCTATAGAAPTYPGAVDPTAIYNVSMNTWTAGPNVPNDCRAHSAAGFPSTSCTLADAPAAVLPDGNILFAASNGYGEVPTHFFEFTSATSSPANSINEVSDPLQNSSTQGAYTYNLMLLPSGQILMTDFSDQPELYTQKPGSGNPPYNPNWQPSISEVPAAIYAGATYTLQGNQIAGLSAGGYYGDDYQGATNYPIVQITNGTTGHVFYARTFGHSTMSIAPGTAGSTNFTVPLNIEQGPHNTIRVIANGIPSDPVGVIGQRSVYAKAPNFNGDQYADILFHNTDGAIEDWLMNGATATAKPNLGTFSNAWSIVGTGDFNGDGISDILLRSNEGAIQIWFMNSSGTVASVANLGTEPNTHTIIGSGDFNGDGVEDILWRDASTGTVTSWFMNTSGAVASKGTVGSLASNWTIVGAGDFNGDGVADILWRDTTGAVQVWLMNTSGKVSSMVNEGTQSNSWAAAGTGDFNGDGVTDILWRNTSGAAQVWFMNTSGTVASTSTIGSLPNTYTIVGTGDFNGDGVSDILWRNTSTGGLQMWFMNTSGAISSTASAGTAPMSWTVVQ